jgi:hypothetical protein
MTIIKLKKSSRNDKKSLLSYPVFSTNHFSFARQLNQHGKNKGLKLGEKK